MKPPSQKKKWNPPVLYVLDFRETKGGDDFTFPEDSGGNFKSVES